MLNSHPSQPYPEEVLRELSYELNMNCAYTLMKVRVELKLEVLVLILLYLHADFEQTFNEAMHEWTSS